MFRVIWLMFVRAPLFGIPGFSYQPRQWKVSEVVRLVWSTCRLRLGVQRPKVLLWLPSGGGFRDSRDAGRSMESVPAASRILSVHGEREGNVAKDAGIVEVEMERP